MRIEEHPTKSLAPLLYDRHEAAARLSISLRTLDEQTARGAIEVIKIGRAVRYRDSALMAFVEACAVRK
ncbi:MAG: helix-turn-helix domain-containing protein [Verrucomicrobiota bacterium JB025]|nr:excisionase family DNA-binding protein [Verrucomicrobiota bacterium JB025]